MFCLRVEHAFCVCVSLCADDIREIVTSLQRYVYTYMYITLYMYMYLYLDHTCKKYCHLIGHRQVSIPIKNLVSS